MFRSRVRIACCLLFVVCLFTPPPERAASEPRPEGAPRGYPAPRPVRMALSPSLSPDAKRVAFSWHGDLWTVPAEGGEAHRLAAGPGYNARPKWSPDGQTIAFVTN